jgi:quercetin dioxygenase-like cupin family protein
VTNRLIATYHIRVAASEIEARAPGVAVEQSVEMPVEATSDPSHAVLILRGHGTCFVGNEVRKVGAHDLVAIPAWHWYQFLPSSDTTMGFPAWSTDSATSRKC